MQEQSSDKETKLPAEIRQTDDIAPAKGKCLHITQGSKGVDFNALLEQVVQYISMGDVLNKIHAGTQYVVQIPTEFQSAYESGEMFIMENMKTGKKWPSLMKIAEDGKQQVVTPLPIAEQTIVQGNPIQELANWQYQLVMQQQMHRLSDVVEKTYRAVERIENGQMDDRIGLLEAGRKGLLLAMTMPEGDTRNRQIDSSRQNLFVAQSQIGKTLERRAIEFEPLPKNPLIRFARVLLHDEYNAEKGRAVEEIQEYYDLYLQATNLLATSYALCGNLETAEQTYSISESELEAIDFSKVETISYEYSELKDMFYSDPVGYLATEQEKCLDKAKSYDYVALEVSGEKLLEVLENGREKQFQKQKLNIDAHRGMEQGAKVLKGIASAAVAIGVLVVNKQNLKALSDTLKAARPLLKK